MPLFGPPDINKLKANRDVPGLIKALGYQKDTYGVMRRTAAETLGAIGDPRAVEPLIAALADERVRITAIEALGTIGDPRAVDPLVSTLNDPERYRREAAAKALGTIGDPRAIEPLIAVVKNGVSFAAARAIIEIDDPRAVEPFIAMLGERDQNVREVAIEVLGALHDSRAVEPLIAVLKGETYALHPPAAKALGALGDPRAIEPLIACLKRHDGYAAEALGAIGDPRAVEPLLAALDDPDQDVRRAAARALVVMYGQGRIDEAQRAAILSLRAVLTASRTHTLAHEDVNYLDNCGFKAHDDANTRHVDEGFEVEFP